MIARYKGDTNKGVNKKQVHSEALYRFVAFFSPTDAIPPADDPAVIKRLQSIALRLFFFIFFLPFPLPTTAKAPSTSLSYLPPTTLGWLRYPLLLFAVVNTRKNCGASLPLYHTILALGIPLCSFMGAWSSWDGPVTEDMQRFALIGFAHFILAVTFRNPSRDLEICGLRLVQEEYLPSIELPNVSDASLPGHHDNPRGRYRRLRDAFDCIVEALSPLDAPRPRDDPRLAYRLFSLGVRLGIFIFLLHPPAATFPLESRGYLRYPLLAIAFYLRQGIDRSAHPIHRKAPLYHSMLSVGIPWFYYAASCKGTSGDGPQFAGVAAVIYGLVAFLVAITFRSRLRHITLWGFEAAP